MASVFVDRPYPAARLGKWELPSVRPATLLVGCGIILITAILIATGLVAGQLRQQAIVTTETELVHLDTLLAEAASHSFKSAEAVLDSVGARLGSATTTDEVAAILQNQADAAPQLATLAAVWLDGRPAIVAGAGFADMDGLADRDFVGALRQQPNLLNFVGAAIADARSGALAIPLARSVTGPQGTMIVAITLPVGEFAALFRAVPLGSDGSVRLFRQDGELLTQYPPRQRGAADIGQDDLGQLLQAARADPTILETPARDRQWLIDAAAPLAGFPLSVIVTRSGERALANWTRQAMLFGGFAVAGAIAIAIMVDLIARQVRTQAALAAVSAGKIEAEQARLAAEAALLKKERLSVLGQLTATVAHELRNPLSAIRNTLFTIKESAAAAGARFERPIARIERSIERCDRIISDLLEYTRTRELRRSVVDLDPWLADLVAEQTVGPTIVLGCEPNAAGLSVAIDSDRIRRVIINLIENAAHALAETPEGSDKRIAVRSEAAGGTFALSVVDTGPGIAPENLARIFEPLFSTKSFGTGLGLATVKQIVEQHGGTITVESEVGRGTTVTVRLPAQPDAALEPKAAA